ncbi:molybdopterin-synthase adenylyltransferase MoeB [Luteimonas deserti]|uniref:Molybdopterin-synthase adenylyltransferase n=1 Tax=Luteimonas deserti TaxID=2752306 RepID=A0A7Z0TZQ9_9GAMM|nr:molybdopterin-synthase adenylyltransferase MoeB [Luteimonas deserti]NYZ64250.1 molybdopterin-synthase adenylyltransferase MoeB [Luteimonas deserti]
MSISEISPGEALRRVRGGVRLIDVREAHERATGMADGAQGVDRASLEAAPQDHAPDTRAPLLLICQTGRRSLLAAEALHAAGYAEVVSVAGGTTRWQSEGLPMTAPDADVDLDFHERYSRHLRLPEVGVDGQRRLAAATVLVVGAGGLGSPAAFYLAAAGVGTLRIADDDVVDRSNLQRQILHAEDRIGMPKVDSAAATLSAMNPRTRIEPVAERVSAANIDRLLDGVDVVLDGADNFPVRYLLNDACVLHGVPLVYGAVHRFEGQVSVFDAGRARGARPCYRCLFPEPPPPEAAPNCSEVGVLGVLPGVIGLLQATEVLKLLLGIGDALAGRLLQFDALRMQFRQTRLAADPACPVCAPGRAFPGYIDYAAFCAAG